MRFSDILNETNNYDVTDDRNSTMHLDDTRKPRLTLRHLNKLRHMREAKKLDSKTRRSEWGKMYASPTEEMGSDDLGF